jgi:hypothetical protein
MEFGFDGAVGVMNRGCKTWREKRGKSRSKKMIFTALSKVSEEYLSG